MFNIIVRVVIIYLIVIFLLRLMGKRQIGEMEPFELVITLIIADLATIPMAEQTVPLWYGVVPLIVISIVHFIITSITNKSSIIRDIISGRPALVINNGKIDHKELKKLSMSAEELSEQLRNMDYPNIGDINYAIIERTGKVTAIPKISTTPPTREDLKVESDESELFYTIFENGKIMNRNFREMNLIDQKDSIMSDILQQMTCKIDELYFANLSNSGTCYAQTHKGTMVELTIDIAKETTEKNEAAAKKKAMKDKKPKGVDA